MVEVLEIHGVKDGNGKPVSIWEDGAWIYLSVPFNSTPGLSALQARHLASKLYRLARRIEQRSEEGK